MDCYARPHRLLLAVVLWHLGFWVLAPLWLYRMLPLDTLELLAWGQEWQWGYYKHPPLAPWFGEAVLQLAGGWLGAMYVLAQACLVVALLYVWRTARLFLDPSRAVLATVLLEGSYFHTYLTPNFNPNSLQLPIWAGLTFHFLKALRGESRHWLAFGVFAALAVLTKYSGLLLLATCAAVLVATPQGRRAWRQPALWLGALLALLALLPHLLWLVQHGALPLAYLRSFGTQAPAAWSAHVIEPLRFASGALLGLLFTALLFLTLRDRRGALPGTSRDAWIVLALCLAPLLLGMLYGVLSGSRLKSTWAFAFFNLAGLALFLWFPTVIDARRWRRFVFALVGVIALGCSSHLIYKTRSDRSKTAWDGPALAAAVASDWQSRYGTPLRIVVADHILGSIVSTYAPSRPSMLVNGDFSLALWLTRAELDADGAAIVCRADATCFPALTAHAEAPRELTLGTQRFRYWFLPPRIMTTP